MLELEIAAFLAAATTRTISDAAKKLYITQPALSRRLQSLEAELGYPLLQRSKGSRTTELTPQGRAFIPLAEKWQQLFEESRNLQQLMENKQSFHLGVIDSVCTYLLPPTFKQFLNENSKCHFFIHKYHLEECYEHMSRGDLDLALVHSIIHSKDIKSVPFFSSPYILISSNPGLQKKVSIEQLNPEKEIRLFWSAEFNTWHDYWFGSNAIGRVRLDMMSLLEYFISDPELWAITPAYIGHFLQEKYGLQTAELDNAPKPITIYYLQPKAVTNGYSNVFLELMCKNLQAHPDITLL